MFGSNYKKQDRPWELSLLLEIRFVVAVFDCAALRLGYAQ